MFWELIETKEPNLNVNEVPGQRAQHLKLGPFNVKAEVGHLGVAQRQQQAGSEMLWY